MRSLVCLSMVTGMALASLNASAYTLPYQNSNRWVASEDAKELRQLVRDAQSKHAHHFTVQLPENVDLDLYIARLEVLRKILERNLKRSVVIEEILPEIAKRNTIVVDMVK